MTTSFDKLLLIHDDGVNTLSSVTIYFVTTSFNEYFYQRTASLLPFHPYLSVFDRPIFGGDLINEDDCIITFLSVFIFVCFLSVVPSSTNMGDVDSGTAFPLTLLLTLKENQE